MVAMASAHRRQRPLARSKCLRRALAFLAVAVLAAGCLRDADEGPPAAVTADGAAVIDLALSAPLPHAIDLTGEQPGVEAASAGTTLASLLDGKRFVATGSFPALSATGGGAKAACEAGGCTQVEFFDFSDGTTIVALVNQAAGTMVDVRVLASGAPAPGPELTATVMEVIDADPRVARAFDGQAYEAVMGPGAVTRDTGPCAEKWCVLVSLAAVRADGTTAAADDTLLVFVDMADQAVVDAFWRSTLRQEVQP